MTAALRACGGVLRRVSRGRRGIGGLGLRLKERGLVFISRGGGRNGEGGTERRESRSGSGRWSETEGEVANGEMG
jgi:hypothetical protein